MLSQNEDENGVKGFYQTSRLKEGLEKKPDEIAEYITKEEAYLLNAIKKGASVIDIGSGTGRVLSLLNGTAGRLVGIDFAARQVSEAQQNVPRAEVYLESIAKKTRFEDNSFDYVLCMYNTFGNLEKDKLPALLEAKRIVKPEGKIIISVYADSVLDAQLRFYEMLCLHVEKVDENSVYLKEGLVSERFTKQRLQELIESAGLYGEIKELTPVSYVAEVRKNNDEKDSNRLSVLR